jgi:hypothetical protein
MKAEGDEIADLQGRPGWKQLRAIELGRVAVVGDGVDRPAPGLIDAIEELAHVFHPDAFTTNSENGKEKIENGARFHTVLPGKESCSCAL